MSLLASLLEAHQAVPASRPSPGTTHRVRPDFVFADPKSGRLALGRFAALGLGAAARELIVTPDRPSAAGSIGGDPEASEFADLARRCGARLLPPGSGGVGSIALDAIAAPGRMLAGPGDLSAAGALGALAWRLGELETAALLACGTLELEAFVPLRVRLHGTMSARCEGHDVAAVLRTRWPDVWKGAVIEMDGDGLACLTVSDRVEIARELSGAGARAVLFPSDDATREFLRARGREADWRRTESGEPESEPLTLELDWVVPHLTAGSAVPLAWWTGTAVSEVSVGRAALFEDLARLAALLRGRRVAEDVWMEARVGSRELARRAEESGVREALVAAGVRWRRDDEPLRAASGTGARLCYGRPSVASGDGSWSAGLQACAAAACAGRIEDPFARAEDGDVPGPAAGAVVRGLGIPAAAAVEPLPEGSTRSTGAIRATLCGPVFARWSHDLDAHALLPPGPRVDARLQFPERLVDDLLPGASRLAGGPGRAPRWLLVQGALGALEGGEAGLLALRSAGVCAILAAAVGADARRRCAEAGMVAMAAARAADLEEIGPGDELELVGGLDVLVLERSRVVRDLTRARAIVVVPELDACEWGWVRAGGRLATVTGAA